MCFRVETKRQIAGEDIICWKVVRATLNPERVASEYGRFYYEFDKKYKVSGPNWMRDKKCNDDINIGFHSYRNRSTAEENCNKDLIIVKCIIPKGSYYFQNTWFDNKTPHHFVSNQIKIVKQYV